MLEAIILGAAQGFAEWLPISSEGLIFLIKTNFFYHGESIKDIAGLALFLHSGTFLAALIYFRKDVGRLVKTIFKFRQAEDKDKKVLTFLFISTLLTGFLGYILLTGADKINLEQLNSFGKIATLLIGLLLLITAFLQIYIKKKGQRGESAVTPQDGVVLGLVQSFAVLPGLSRSGLTIATLLFRNFQDTAAIRLSFLMSLPVVLGGNILLNWKEFSSAGAYWWGLVAAFFTGIITIHLFIKLARRLNFGYFVLVFGLLMIVAALI